MTPEQAKIVQAARKNADERAKGYREQALKLYPWICGRCTCANSRTPICAN